MSKTEGPKTKDKIINEDFVKKLDRPLRGQHIEWDSKIPGFGVRINAGGAIAFVLNYTLNGRRRRFKIGRYPAWNATTAREEAKALSVGIDRGTDPQDQKLKSQSEPTFRELAERYLEEHAETHKRASSVRTDRGKIRRLLPLWGGLQVKAISQDRIEKLKRDLKGTPYHANRTLALLSKMFNLSVKWKYRTDNPVKGIEKFKEHPRDFHLTEQQVVSLKQALDAYHNQNAADAIRLLLLTGAREGETLIADWTQFDLKLGVWTKPSHHTKENKEEHIPLNDDALALLRKMGPQKSGPLFPGKNGGSRVTLRKPWIQICKAAGLVTSVERLGKKRWITRYRPNFHIHDLRHTYASWLVSNGVPLYDVSKLMGHTRMQTTERYAHHADASLRRATNVFGKLFRGAGGKKGKR
ncbi:MAG TPA: tyrosine-type recombinase/integrase [Candidatus Polarisedimenticolia bacterium]|nr:tyrosine-type recombinase/integrase [Candidatus Polarisedimenticolia bacterium]